MKELVLLLCLLQGLPGTTPRTAEQQNLLDTFINNVRNALSGKTPSVIGCTQELFVCKMMFNYDLNGRGSDTSKDTSHCVFAENNDIANETQALKACLINAKANAVCNSMPFEDEFLFLRYFHIEEICFEECVNLPADNYTAMAECVKLDAIGGIQVQEACDKLTVGSVDMACIIEQSNCCKVAMVVEEAALAAIFKLENLFDGVMELCPEKMAFTYACTGASACGAAMSTCYSRFLTSLSDNYTMSSSSTEGEEHCVYPANKTEGAYYTDLLTCVTGEAGICVYMNFVDTVQSIYLQQVETACTEECAGWSANLNTGMTCLSSVDLAATTTTTEVCQLLVRSSTAMQCIKGQSPCCPITRAAMVEKLARTLRDNGLAEEAELMCPDKVRFFNICPQVHPCTEAIITCYSSFLQQINVISPPLDVYGFITEGQRPHCDANVLRDISDEYVNLGRCVDQQMALDVCQNLSRTDQIDITTIAISLKNAPETCSDACDNWFENVESVNECNISAIMNTDDNTTAGDICAQLASITDDMECVVTASDCCPVNLNILTARLQMHLSEDVYDLTNDVRLQCRKQVDMEHICLPPTTTTTTTTTTEAPVLTEEEVDNWEDVGISETHDVALQSQQKQKSGSGCSKLLVSILLSVLPALVACSVL